MLLSITSSWKIFNKATLNILRNGLNWGCWVIADRLNHIPKLLIAWQKKWGMLSASSQEGGGPTTLNWIFSLFVDGSHSHCTLWCCKSLWTASCFPNWILQSPLTGCHSMPDKINGMLTENGVSILLKLSEAKYCTTSVVTWCTLSASGCLAFQKKKKRDSSKL